MGYIIFWPAAAMICAVVMVAEAASLIRVLFRTGQARRWYLLTAIPLATSVWAFATGWDAGTAYQFLFSYTAAHPEPMIWEFIWMMVDRATLLCQIVLVATVVVFLAFQFLLLRRHIGKQSPLPIALQIAMVRR